MKNIKNLGITTKEGFEVRDLQRFPSMEWGDEGGFQAELYYKGNHIMRVYQKGDGGCAYTYPENYYNEHKVEIDLQCLRFLQRVDKSYGSDSPYEWLRNKVVSGIDDDDWEAVVNNIEERYAKVNAANKAFKNGYKAVVALINDYRFDYLYYQVSDITENEVCDFLKKKGLDKQYQEIEILLPTPELNVL